MGNYIKIFPLNNVDLFIFFLNNHQTKLNLGNTVSG